MKKRFKSKYQLKTVWTIPIILTDVFSIFRNLCSDRINMTSKKVFPFLRSDHRNDLYLFSMSVNSYEIYCTDFVEDNMKDDHQ